jgi:hypothetical protein
LYFVLLFLSFLYTFDRQPLPFQLLIS